MKHQLSILCLGVLGACSVVMAGVYPNDDDNLWPNQVVPYQFGGSVSAYNRSIVLQAMAKWEAEANVDFVVRNGEADYLSIVDAQGGAGSSYPPPAGYRPGTGAHTLNIRINLPSLGNQTQQVYGIAHEVGHVLGLDHTMQRIDRDNYITVNTDNMAGGQGNFAINPNSLAWPRDQIDIDSIMNYGLCFFTSCGNCPADPDNCATVTLLPPLDTEWAGNLFCPAIENPGDVCIGHRNHLSTWDKLLMSFLYPEPNYKFIEQDYDGFVQDGSFYRPYDDFGTGELAVPPNSVLWIMPGEYTQTADVYSKPLVLRAPLGDVVIRE